MRTEWSEQPAKNFDSFPETADIETSSDDYASRFSGPTGEWLLSVQEKIVQDFLQGYKKGSILDVGGGHGQLAYPLAEQGWKVTILGSDKSCERRILPLVESGKCQFQVGNLIKLPFPDRSFDHVVCFRFVSHCTRWEQLLRELARVARHSVILDYPTQTSWNVLTPFFFGVKKKLEGNTRTYSMFSHRQIETPIRECGFSEFSRCGQFFLPMVIHRKLQSPALSARMEGVFRTLQLTRSFGSPIILQAKRV